MAEDAEARVRARCGAPSWQLSGEDGGRYVSSVVAGLNAARLNASFPDPKRLASHIEAMGPTVHGGLYPGVDVDRRSGLPTYKEWTRVQTDAFLARQFLDELPPEEELAGRAASEPGGVYGRMLLKRRYYQALLGRSLAVLGDMEATLRRVSPDGRSASYRVVLDKLDARGLHVRHTVLLAQKAIGRSLIRREDDMARQTEEMRSLVYRQASIDAELCFADLASRPGVTVESVVRGTFGPVLFAGVEPSPGALPLEPRARGFVEAVAEMVRGSPGSAVLAFASDMAATDLQADVDNDPMEDPISSRMSDQARAEYLKCRARYGFKVFRDRRFVASRDLCAGLADLCRRAGTNSVITGY